MFWTITHSFINWMHFNIFIWNLCAMESTYETLLISSFRIYGHAHTLAINKNMNIRQNNCWLWIMTVITAFCIIFQTIDKELPLWFLIFSFFYFFWCNVQLFLFFAWLAFSKRLRWFLGRFSTKDFCDFHIGGFKYNKKKLLFINVLCAAAHGWMKN